jgi:hypothetical protein
MKILRNLNRTLIAVSSLLLTQPLMAQVPATPGGEVPATLVQVENPFEVGTGVQQVAPNVEATLAEFAATTRNRINQVLRDTATENEATAYTALIDAARRIVQASNRTQRGRELLTRILINQALELTTGTPDASGVVPPARTGLLTRLQTPSLDTLPLAIVVLRQSFEMARDHAEQDLAAATALEGNASSSASAPLQLPYAEAAANRLNAAMAWNRIATTKGPELEYQFLRISIQQWRNIVTNPNHQQVTSLATQIERLDTGVTRAATRLTTNPPTLTQFTEAARVLRGFLRELNDVRVQLAPSLGITEEASRMLSESGNVNATLTTDQRSRWIGRGTLSRIARAAEHLAWVRSTESRSVSFTLAAFVNEVNRISGGRNEGNIAEYNPQFYRSYSATQEAFRMITQSEDIEGPLTAAQRCSWANRNIQERLARISEHTHWVSHNQARNLMFSYAELMSEANQLVNADNLPQGQSCNCPGGQVWREATPGDIQCVTPQERDSVFRGTFSKNMGPVAIDLI